MTARDLHPGRARRRGGTPCTPGPRSRCRRHPRGSCRSSRCRRCCARACASRPAGRGWRRRSDTCRRPCASGSGCRAIRGCTEGRVSGMPAAREDGRTTHLLLAALALGACGAAVAFLGALAHAGGGGLAGAQLEPAGQSGRDSRRAVAAADVCLARLMRGVDDESRLRGLGAVTAGGARSQRHAWVAAAWHGGCAAAEGRRWSSRSRGREVDTGRCAPLLGLWTLEGRRRRRRRAGETFIRDRRRPLQRHSPGRLSPICHVSAAVGWQSAPWQSGVARALARA